MGLRADEAARVPFSIIAVLVLLLANASVLYIWTVNQSRLESDLRRAEIRAMEEVASLTHSSLELEVRYLALDVVRTAGVPLVNESRLNGRLAERIAKYVAAAFPREIRGCRVAVEAAHAAILLGQRTTEDIVPSSGTRRSILNATTVDVPDTVHLGVRTETSRIAYFSLVGAANYTVSKEKVVLRTTRVIIGDLESPVPVLESALGATAAAADGTAAEMGRMVRYMLTTAAQYRVLQGYAAGEYGEAGTTPRDVLTPTDVEVAVNLALLLEEIRRFRALDADAASAVNATFFPLFVGRANTNLAPTPAARTISALLDAYANGGYVDPADLFALFEAMDAAPIRLNTILAQAIDAIVDQYTVRYLDYFGLAGLADMALEVVERLARAIQDFLDWVSGHDREADLVTSFVRELFKALGETTVVLHPSSADVPKLDYVVAAADGSRVTITIPGHAATIRFNGTDMTLYHDPLWKSYYATLFAGDLRRVHTSVRDFVANLATSIASDANLIGAIPNPELRGHVDPKDEESILAYVDARMRSAIDDALENLRSNPGYLESLISNLWHHQVNLSEDLFRFVEGRYDELANATDAIAAAKPLLVGDLFAKASEDPDWILLEASGRQLILAFIANDVAARGWVEAGYANGRRGDFERFSAMAARAAAMATPPAQGGIYQRIVESVTRTTGVLQSAGHIIKGFSEGLIGSAEVRNTQVLLPVARDDFAFWSGDRKAAASRGAVRYESFWVQQEPAVLRATVVGGSDAWKPDALRVGDLWIEVVDPSAQPKDAGVNVHYADVRELSKRPYEAQWNVRIAGAVRLTGGTTRAVYLGPAGHEPARGSVVVPIRMAFSLRIASGWPLLGVQYASSTTLGAEVWKAVTTLVDAVWESIAYAFDWMLDALAKVVESLIDLLRQLASYAAEVLKALVESLRTTVELLQEWIGGALGALVPALETAVSIRGSKTVTIHAWGISFDVFWGSREPGNKFQVNATGEWFYAEARFVLLNETGASDKQLARVKTPWDVLGYARFTVSHITVSLDIDPLMVVQDHLVEGTARPDAGGWELAFSVPYVEYFQERAWAIDLPTVPTPLGTLDIEIGARLRLWGTPDIPGFADAMKRSFDEAFSVFYGREIDFDAVALFARRLVERFLHNALQAVADEIAKVKEIVLYVEGVFKAGAAAGGGFRLAFVAEGESLVYVFQWLVDNILTFFHNLLRPNAPAEYPALPPGVPEHLFVRGEVLAAVGMPKVFQRAAGASVPGEFRFVFQIQGNVPALGNLLGEEWGRWRVDFGAYIERVPHAIAGPLFGTAPEVDIDVWLFRASVYEL